LHTSIFSEEIPFKRFVLLSKFLNFNNETLPVKDHLRKLRPVLNHLKQNFREVYYPQENVAIDESLIKFTGRLRYVQSNPRKMARFVIKIYKICESVSAYCIEFSIYRGKKPDQGETQGILCSVTIVNEMVEPYLQHGHTVFMDNWYTSPSLFLKLGEKKCNRDSKSQPQKHATAVQCNKNGER
jgi:hypothetical protein